MTGALLVVLLTCAFLGAILLLLPRFSPQRFFFSITVPPEFRESETARASLRRYRVRVGAATAASLAAAWFALVSGDAANAVFAPLIPAFVGLIAFLLERAAVRRIAPRPAGPPLEVPQAPVGDGLPRWTILAAVPVLFPAATALYLQANWDAIPDKFPVHWGLNGEPNGWSVKTFRGIYGPLLFGEGLLVLIAIVGVAMYYGSRRGPVRRPVLAMLIATMYLIGLAFSSVGLMPLMHIPAAALLVPFAVFLALLLVWSKRASQTATGEVTPDECWLLGGIYYNRNDPALFVQKRFGIGYTLNFGNRRSWVLLAVFGGGILALLLLLPR